MFDKNDEQYLLRAISANRCVLFVGAGFSSLAKNRNTDALPSGRQLAAAISRLLGYDPSHDESPLTDLFEVLITSGLPRTKINQFLEQQLLCSDVPAIYDAITLPFWNRIYTTNADDLLPIVYRRAATVQAGAARYGPARTRSGGPGAGPRRRA